MNRISDREIGITVRFVKAFDILPDQHPHAASWGACPQCGRVFWGEGSSLLETMADIRAQWDKHECPRS